jgi:hypothetical protein
MAGAPAGGAATRGAGGGAAGGDGNERTGLGVGIGRTTIGGFTLTGGFALTGDPTTGETIERVVCDGGNAPRVITPRLPKTGESKPSPTV